MNGRMAAARLLAEAHLLLLVNGSPAVEAGFLRLWDEVCQPPAAEPPMDEADALAVREIEAVPA